MNPRPGDDEDEFKFFFDDRRIFAATRATRPSWFRLRLPDRGLEWPDMVVGGVLLGISIAVLVVMRSTSSEQQNEVAGSSYFGPALIGAVAVVAVASVLRPFTQRPLLWTVVTVGPWIAVLVIEGWVLFDPDRGAWLGGMYLVPLTVSAVACWLAGLVAAGLRQRRMTAR